MPDRQSGEAERLVKPGAARHEHELDEREIGSEEGQELARRVRDGARSREAGEATVADPHPDDDDAIHDDHHTDIAGPDGRAPRNRWWRNGDGAIHLRRG